MVALSSLSLSIILASIFTITTSGALATPFSSLDTRAIIVRPPPSPHPDTPPPTPNPPVDPTSPPTGRTDTEDTPSTSRIDEDDTEDVEKRPDADADVKDPDDEICGENDPTEDCDSKSHSSTLSLPWAAMLVGGMGVAGWLGLV